MAKIEFQEPQIYQIQCDIRSILLDSAHRKINNHYKEKEKKYSDLRYSKSLLGKITQFQGQNKSRKTIIYTLITYNKVY